MLDGTDTLWDAGVAVDQQRFVFCLSLWQERNIAKQECPWSGKSGWLASEIIPICDEFEIARSSKYGNILFYTNV